MRWQLFTFALVLGVAAQAVAQDKPTTGTEKPGTAESAEASSDDGQVMVSMKTNRGEILLALDAEKAPISTLNFLDYAKADFYDGTIFHRVMSNFMIQGGGYTPEMELKSGVREPIMNEWKNGLKNTRGTISMARLGRQPHSATCQFFINVKDNDALDMPRDGAGYAVFGKVVDGMDVVDTIRNTDVIEHPKLPMGEVVPSEPVVIEEVKQVGGMAYDEVVKRAKAALDTLKAEEAARKQAEAAAREARMKERAAAREARIEEGKPYAEKYRKLLENGKTEDGKELKTTDSGLKYVVLSEGTSVEKPAPTDTVTVHYTGRLLSNGVKFDSSRDRGEPTSFPLNRVIKGWTEGVGMMTKGSTYLFIIAPDLAYGAREIPDRGGRPGIPANSTLVFEVELIDF